MSLHVESVPGKKDFRPVETSYGECLMFWGNQCKHYTVANNSGNSRVSLDFRCMERERYNPNFINLKGKPTQFRLGEYYSDREWLLYRVKRFHVYFWLVSIPRASTLYDSLIIIFNPTG